MANDTIVTVVGNLTADVELRFLSSGVAVGSFTIASTPSHFDKQQGKFVDDPTLFMRCTVWRESAENAAESLTKGMRVIAQGRLTQREYETSSGEKRTVVELQVDEVGPSLRYASAKVTRAQRSGGSSSAPSSGSFDNDPWSTSQPVGGGNDEPAF